MSEITQTLVVTRYGSIDEEYYAVEHREQVKQAFREFGREVATGIIQAAVGVGKGIVWLFTHEHDIIQ